MVKYSTALHFPALVVMSVPVTSVLHFIVAHVIVTENCAKYRYRYRNNSYKSLNSNNIEITKYTKYLAETNRWTNQKIP